MGGLTRKELLAGAAAAGVIAGCGGSSKKPAALDPRDWASVKAQYPLAEARVEVQAVKGKPGWYNAVAWLRPHFQLETLTTSFRLVAEVPKKVGG